MAGMTRNGNAALPLARCTNFCSGVSSGLWALAVLGGSSARRIWSVMALRLLMAGSLHGAAGLAVDGMMDGKWVRTASSIFCGIEMVMANVDGE